MRECAILNSWKEIALYMGRAVRTVQRWEEDCRLPVRRPRGRKRSSVFALSSEIDLWLQTCPLAGNNGGNHNHRNRRLRPAELPVVRKR